MDVTLMRSFLAVVDTGAITEAAARLSITQPALSRRIQALEEHFGVALLNRGRKGVTVTDVGELVAREARVLVSRFDNLRNEITSHVGLETGTVRLGGGATAVSFVLPKAIADFQVRHPGVRFQLKEAGSREVEQNVVDGALELGMVTLPVSRPELDVRPLTDDRIVLIAPQDHPLAGPGQVPLSALHGAALVGFERGSAIRQLVDTGLRQAGISMNVVMALRSIPAIIRMVRSTGNLAFVSAMGVDAEPDIALLQVEKLDIRRTLAVISRRGAALSPAASAFAATMY